MQLHIGFDDRVLRNMCPDDEVDMNFKWARWVDDDPRARTFVVFWGTIWRFFLTRDLNNPIAACDNSFIQAWVSMHWLSVAAFSHFRIKWDL